MNHSNPTKRFVLVTGATGQQGGSVALSLLQKGHRVRALTRNTESDSARELAGRGVELAKGDFTDQESLVAALDGVDTLFLMTTPFESGVDAETTQGLQFVEAARKTGVGHIVFSSVASADQNTGIPHFDSKFAVEKALADSGIPYSIFAPVYFMENAIGPWTLDGLKAGKLALAMPADTALQQVSLQTIGEFATSLIERREEVFSERFDIASDELTGANVAQAISDASGSEIGYEGFPPAYMREQNEDFAIMFEWFETVGYSVNIEKLRADFPDVSFPSFKEWAGKQDWEEIGLVGASAVN